MILRGELDDQKCQLKTAIDSLKGGKKYIESHDSLRLAPYNRRTAITAMDGALKVLEPKLTAVIALQDLQRNFANRIVVPDDSGEYAGNGKFYIQFVNVGMGDCTLITTPKGIKIMVDCGSSALSDVTSLIPGYNPAINGSAEKIVGDAIASKTFLHGSSEIEILVLTHPDEDLIINWRPS
jgi:beta-lactamase superfamily II metal-dependent hydrolase